MKFTGFLFFIGCDKTWIMWYMWLWWRCLQWNQLVLVKWLGVKVILLVWICCAKASIVHAVCCGCLLKRNVDVIWRTKLLLQKLSQKLSRCTDVARWADRFEKIPICQISTATSGPDSPRPPTEISLVGGCEFIFRFRFRASLREVVRVLRKGCQISWLLDCLSVEIFWKWFREVVQKSSLFAVTKNIVPRYCLLLLCHKMVR